MKTDCAGRSASEQRAMFVTHQHLSTTRRDAKRPRFIFYSEGLVLCSVSVHGGEWVHPCLKTMIHCSMERLCVCGNILVWEQLWFMLILHTFWPDYCSTKNSYWFNLVSFPFLLWEVFSSGKVKHTKLFMRHHHWVMQKFLSMLSMLIKSAKAGYTQLFYHIWYMLGCGRKATVK